MGKQLSNDFVGCKNLKIENKIMDFFGTYGQNKIVPVYICKLRLTNSNLKEEMGLQLFDLGIGNGSPSIFCPLEGNNLSSCPYYKKGDENVL